MATSKFREDSLAELMIISSLGDFLYSLLKFKTALGLHICCFASYPSNGSWRFGFKLGVVNT